MITKRLIAAGLVAGLSVGMAAEAADVDSLMSRMTLKEKIGQLNLGGVGTPLVVGSALGLDVAIDQGLVSAMGGLDNKAAADALRYAMDHMRVPVPLLTGLDVVHGYHTIFPIPLGAAASWDLALIEQSARCAAVEATACGVNWTFAPMVDIARDPRWGRVAEGAGEDPYLGSLIAKAYIHGYQGDDLADPTTMLACVKHFGLYGASEAGRDYNTVSMDEVTARNYYLPTYKAGFDAGAATGMTSFNVVNGVPATANTWLLNTLLRQEWQWQGFIVSDANAIAEMTVHGLGDAHHVAAMALNAGTDMDLGASLYPVCLAQAVGDGSVSEAAIDRACRRVLLAKQKLGLLDDPFRYLHTDAYRDSVLLCPHHLQVARRLAAESIVLLKNDGGFFPIAKDTKVYLAGDMADAREDYLGCWSYDMSRTIMSTPREALTAAGITLVATPEEADRIVVITGEKGSLSGEAHCLASPTLTDAQLATLAALKATGKPLGVVIVSGRPLVVPTVDRECDAVMAAWHGGTMAAEAMADIITGAACPSGKLTISWPRAIGQIPIYYNALPTGRPAGNFWATSKYLDCPNDPLYPFGYGLSYNSYSYSAPTLDKTEAHGDDDAITVAIDVTNNGPYTGRETVQLYIRDPVAKISRPVKELKDFAQLLLAPGETKRVVFRITTDKLMYYNADNAYDWDEGEFTVMTGPDSAHLQSASIHWHKQ